MDNITKTLQLILLGVILVSTVIAVGIEIRTMFFNQSVTLADLLLMFLYLEVMAMVRVFGNNNLFQFLFTSINCYNCFKSIYNTSR